MIVIVNVVSLEDSILFYDPFQWESMEAFDDIWCANKLEHGDRVIIL